jgi:hypothetical protein
LTIGPDRIRDATVESTVDLRPAALGLLVQGREPRQLEAFPNQLFDRHIDDVGQILHPLRRESNDRGKYHLPSLIKALDSEISANDLYMTTTRPGVVVVACAWNDEHPAIVTDMFDDATRHVSQGDEIAKPLKGLQQNQKRQLRGFALRRPIGQLQLGIGRRVKISQVPATRGALQPRVYGFVNGRHGSPRIMLSSSITMTVGRPAKIYRFRPARRDYQKAAPIQYFKTHF